MKWYDYSNEWGESYRIYKMGRVWHIWQDGVKASGEYRRLKDAKKAIDNQEVYF